MGIAWGTAAWERSSGHGGSGDLTRSSNCSRPLYTTNLALQEQVLALTARLEALEERAGKDSHNSHKPPSSDGLAKKPIPSLRSKTGLQRPSQPPLLPDPKMTPGNTLDVTVQDICTPGYTKKIRNVPAEVKRQVYPEYGIRSHQMRPSR